MRKLFRTGELDEPYQDERVIILNLPFRPQRVPTTLPRILYQQSMGLVEEIVEAQPNVDPSILRRAAQAILSNETIDVAMRPSFFSSNPTPKYAVAISIVTIAPGSKRADSFLEELGVRAGA